MPQTSNVIQQMHRYEIGGDLGHDRADDHAKIYFKEKEGHETGNRNINLDRDSHYHHGKLIILPPLLPFDHLLIFFFFFKLA